VGHIIPVQVPSHVLKIRFNIILPSMPRSSKLSLSFRFFHQTLYAPLIPHTCYMPRPSNFPDTYGILQFSGSCRLYSVLLTEDRILRDLGITSLIIWEKGTDRFFTLLPTYRNHISVCSFSVPRGCKQTGSCSVQTGTFVRSAGQVTRKTKLILRHTY